MFRIPGTCLPNRAATASPLIQELKKFGHNLASAGQWARYKRFCEGVAYYTGWSMPLASDHLVNDDPLPEEGRRPDIQQERTDMCQKIGTIDIQQ